MSAQPLRIRLSRRAGFNLQKLSRELNGLTAINCARPSKWGNPHKIGLCPRCGVEHTRDEAVAEFAAELDELKATLPLEDLRGKNLACFCKYGQACHADVLLEIANESKMDNTMRIAKKRNRLQIAALVRVLKPGERLELFGNSERSMANQVGQTLLPDGLKTETDKEGRLWAVAK